MRRLLLFTFFIVALDASATCQDCPGNGTLNAMCRVVSKCDFALYAACYEAPTYDASGEIVYEVCRGSGAGPDCNRPDSECESGSGDPGGGGGGGGDNGCTWGPLGCPAYCSSCSWNDN